MGNSVAGMAEADAKKVGKDKTRLTVAISDLKTTKDPNVFLVTHSLGPCIGLILFDPIVKAAGLLHFQLPTAKGHEERARTNPFMFGDTGIPILFDRMAKHGAKKDRMIVSIFGGASMLADDKIFKIGVQNARAAKKILWQLCVNIKHEDVGGKVSRTVGIELDSGLIRLQKEGQIYIF